MKTENLHKIRTQSIEISFENSGDYTGMQNKLAELFYEMLQPQMEVIFDEMFGMDQHIAIDKLEIDLGTLNTANWEQEFTGQAISKLKGELLNVQKDEIESIKIKESSVKESFFYYLENGSLPWDKPFDSIQDLEKQLIINETLVSQIKKLFIRNPKASERLVMQFSENFTKQVVNEITKERQNVRNAIFGLLENANLLSTGKPVAADTYRQLNPHTIDFILLNVFSENENANTMEQFFAILLTKLNSNTEQYAEISEIVTHLRANKLYSNLAQEKEWLTFDESGDHKKQASGKEENHENKNENISQNDHQNVIAKMEKEDQGIADEAIYINNAGLVLLHPFLQHLFELLAFTRENQWIDISAQAQAVLVSEFLVSGSNEFEEFNLVLNKILCGFAPDEIVSTKFVLTDQVKAECEQLLNAVIAHWNVLRNTSIGGLRESFLHRNGKLSKVDNGWLLQVEHKSVDILLNQLPWGIGIVNLPWMNEILYVEWT